MRADTTCSVAISSSNCHNEPDSNPTTCLCPWRSPNEKHKQCYTVQHGVMLVLTSGTSAAWCDAVFLGEGRQLFEKLSQTG